MTNRKSGTLLFFSSGGSFFSDILDVIKEGVKPFYRQIITTPGLNTLAKLENPSQALEALEDTWKEWSGLKPNVIVFGAYVPSVVEFEDNSAQQCAELGKAFVEKHLLPLKQKGVKIFLTAEYAHETGVSQILDREWMLKHTDNPDGQILSRSEDYLKLIQLLEEANPKTTGKGSAIPAVDPSQKKAA